MKLQPASKKEIKRVTIGTAVCDCLLVAALFLLSQFDIGTFDLKRILLGVLCGSLVSVGCFVAMCITIQNAVGIEDQKQMKAKFQLSYNARTFIQAIWIVAAFLLEPIHFIAGAAPVFFPKVTILFLQATGRLNPSDTSDSETPGSSEA